MLAIKDGDSVLLPVESSEMSSYSRREIRALIHTAVTEGFINTTKVKRQYKFLHDSIQEASYSLLTLEESRSLHLQIGSLTFQNSTEREFEKMLFFAVDHLNKGSLLIQSEETKMHLSNLNLRAAQKAIKSSAYGPATEYLKTGIRLLCTSDWEDDNSSDGHWENDYKLSLELFTSLVECLFCTGCQDQIEKHVNEIFRHARCFADKQRAHSCLIKCLTAKGEFEEAIDVGFEGLAQLGENFPSSVSTRVILPDLIKTMLMLAGKGNENLSSLPPMKNEDKLAAMEIMADIGLPMFICRPKYMPLLAFRAVRISLKFGLCNKSANAFAGYGLILGTGLGQYKNGYRFGQLALALAEKHKTSECIAYVNVLVYSSINPWVVPLKKTIDPLKHTQLAGMEAGTVEFACNASVGMCIHSLITGELLSIVERDMHFAIQRMTEFSIKAPKQVITPFYKSVLKLMGRSENQVIEEEIQLTLIKERSNTFVEEVCYINEVLISYMFGHFNRARGFAEKLLEDFSDMGSQMEELVKSFFCGLTWLALAKKTKNKKLKKLGMKQMKKFKKWSQHAPFNCLQKFYLLKAECAALQRRYSRAKKYYNEAIRLSRTHGFLSDEALAHERFGIFYSERQNIDAACEHLTIAEELYGKWGAHAKVKHVRSEIRTIVAS